MEVYYATLVSTYICSLLSMVSEKQRHRILAGVWIVFTAVILVAFTGLRSGIGDTGMYKHTYEGLVANPKFTEDKRDIGFQLLNLILVQFSSNPQTIVLVVALITIVCNIYILNKYRSAIELQVFIYIASGYLTVTMNGMRQCLAAALVFLCTPLVIKGKFKTYLICILLISTFHQSALFMIPIYFIVRMKPWTKEFYFMIGAACIGVIFYDVLSPYLFKALENTQYGHYSEFEEGGSTLIRTLVNMVPLILAYMKRDELKEKWPVSDIFVNMALLNCIFVAFGMADWIFNRFTIYIQLYNFILMPFIIKNCFEGKEKRLLYFLFILCYSFFFYKEQVLGLGIKYSSVLDFNSLFYYIRN